MIVSISRELGAGGGTIGEAVARTIGAPLLDERSIIEELARRIGISEAQVARRVERPPSLGETVIADLARASAMLPFNSTFELPSEPLIDTVRSLVFEYAERGNVVVIGHGGRAMLGWRPAGVAVLAVLLQAGLPWRIRQLALRIGIDTAEAERRIARIDEARRRFHKYYFDSDMYDSRQYDLVLHTERLGLERATATATSIASHLAG